MTGHPLVAAGSYGPAGASMRVRVLEWLRVLDLPAEVVDYMGAPNARPATLLADPLGVVKAERLLRALRRRRPAPERLLISRSMGPFTAGRLEADLLRAADWGVYDFDDALYADDRGGIHRFFGEASGWARSVAAADHVIAGNTTLAEAAAAVNPSVDVIPSCVDPDDYPQKTDYAMGAVPRLIWMGSPSTEWYVHDLAPALLQVHELTGARLSLVSSGRQSLGELDGIVDRVEWHGAATNALLAEADCGVMPLPDTPFTRGKCAYKLLQYGAAGLPAVASPVGVNAQVLDQLHGLAATGVDEWVEATVSLLRESDEQRRARGVVARRAVEEDYSYEAWRNAFLRALHLPTDDTRATGTAPTDATTNPRK
jgi:glycosyltransferase involved in cell wall biosynthesis